MDRDDAQRLLESDQRVDNLVDWLMARYEPLDLEYKIATTFSLGMMISAYEYEFNNPEYYEKIVSGLDNLEVTPERVVDLPSLIFMLPSFSFEETAPLVTKVVE